MTLGICLLFITLCCSGCELLPNLPKDYVPVKCMAEIRGYLKDKNNNTLQNKYPVGLQIKVDFIKDDGERFTYQRTLGIMGEANTGIATFKLYKEQPIEAVLIVQGGYKDYDPIVAVLYQTLTWEQVKEVADIAAREGNTEFAYFWSPYFYIFLQNNSLL